MNITKNGFVVPNKPVTTKDCVLYTKEAIQKAYLDKIGKVIDFLGIRRKVVNVKVTDEFIHVELEVLNDS